MNKYIILSLFSILIITLFFLQIGWKGGKIEGFTASTPSAFASTNGLQNTLNQTLLTFTPFGLPQYAVDISNIAAFNSNPSYIDSAKTYYELLVLHTVLTDTQLASFITALDTKLNSIAQALKPKLNTSDLSNMQTMANKYSLASMYSFPATTTSAASPPSSIASILTQNVTGFASDVNTNYIASLSAPAASSTTTGTTATTGTTK